VVADEEGGGIRGYRSQVVFMLPRYISDNLNSKSVRAYLDMMLADSPLFVPSLNVEVIEFEGNIILPLDASDWISG